MDEAQKTRFITIEMTFDAKEWSQWADSQGVDGRAINFLLLNPEIVKGAVNPRSLVTFFNAISSIKNFENSLPMIQMIGEGSVGVETAGMFVSFINNKLDKLLTPQDIMLKDWTAIEPKLKELVGDASLGNYRADIASVLCTRVQNYSINYAVNNSIEDKYIDRLEELILGKYFGVDLNYSLVKTLFASGQKFKKLTLRKELTKYVIS